MKPGQTIKYLCYGAEKTGTIARIGSSGIVFLTTGRFVHPESIIKTAAKGGA